MLGEENPESLEQLIRLPGQQYDEESGLYYNRHRYYNPGQGRYITQDPIGLTGGWNVYTYPLNPKVNIDPLTLSDIPIYKFNSQDEAALFAMKMCSSTSIIENMAGKSVKPIIINILQLKLSRKAWLVFLRQIALVLLARLRLVIITHMAFTLI